MIKIGYIAVSAAILEVGWYLIFEFLPDFLMFPRGGPFVGWMTLALGFFVFLSIAVVIGLTSKNVSVFLLTTALVSLLMGFNALIFSFLNYSPPNFLFGLTELLVILILILDPIFLYFFRKWVVKRFA